MNKVQCLRVATILVRQVLIVLLLLIVEGCGCNYWPSLRGDNVWVSRCYISKYCDYRLLDIPTLTGYCEQGEKFIVGGIPAGCRAVMLEGDFDLSNVQANDSIEYFSERFCMRSGDALKVLVQKLPCLKVLETEGVQGPGEDSFDMGIFDSLPNLELLGIKFGGGVMNADALFDRRKAYTLHLSVLHSSNCVGVNTSMMSECLNLNCGCKQMLNNGAYVGVVTNSYFRGGARMFVMTNDSEDPVMLGTFPDCCKGLDLHGRCTFKDVKVNDSIESISLDDERVTQSELDSIDFAKFPELKYLYLCLESPIRCEVDLSKLKVCPKLQEVFVLLDGACIARGIDYLSQRDGVYELLIDVWFSHGQK